MTIGVSKMKIQGVASCHYLCMDRCGLLYGSQEFGEECVFNETIEPDHYNTYSSAKYSNDRRTFYLALNRRGQPRKLLLRALQPLGRLSSYVRVLVRTISAEKYQELYSTYDCPPSIATNNRSAEINLRCGRLKKRKKFKKKCVQEELKACHTKKTPRKRKRLHFKFRKKCPGEESCVGRRKKKLSRGTKHKKKRVEIVTEDATELDQDYAVETTTYWDWDDPMTEKLSTSYTD